MRGTIRESARVLPSRQWARALRESVAAAAGWVFAWPLTCIVPRDQTLVIFRGRDGGRFLDNCKYLFIATRRLRPGLRAVFLDAGANSEPTAEGAEFVRARGIRAAWLWLRAGTIVVDSVDWLGGMRFAGSRGARIVQLWHGVPLKQVQLGRIQARRATQPAWEAVLFRLYLALVGRLSTLDWFLSPGRAVTDFAFAGSFRYRHVSHAGYPRNDVLFRVPSGLDLAGTDAGALAAVHEHRHAGGRVALYAPTFREGFPDPFGDGGLDLASLGTAAAAAGLLLLVKLHPWMTGRPVAQGFPGIVFVDAGSDVYPLLREVDLLLTDYSSVFFDFLLLDRPVAFVPYDLADYLSGDRPMYFDYAEMTPGPKYPDIATLAEALPGIIADGERWSHERARVRSLVFDHEGAGAASRLLDELFPA